MTHPFNPEGYNLNATSTIFYETPKTETWGMSKKTELDTLASLERGYIYSQKSKLLGKMQHQETYNQECQTNFLDPFMDHFPIPDATKMNGTKLQDAVKWMKQHAGLLVMVNL